MLADLNITIIPKQREWYILAWDDDHLVDALRKLGEWATNPRLSFTMKDAEAEAKKIQDSLCRGVRRF